MTRPLHALREAALWVAAALGTLCLACAVAAVGFGMTPLIFSSGSMSPGIPTGSLALAVSTPAADLRPGDIVSAAWSDGQRVTHRLVGKQPAADGRWALTTRGDANNVEDAEHPVVDRVDRVIWSAPGWGFAIDEVTKPQWVFTIGVVVGGLVVLVFRGTRRAAAEPRAARARRPAPRHVGEQRHEVRNAGMATAGVVAALALAASLLAPAPTATLAAYVDAGAARGAFATATVLPPTVTGCTVTNNVLGIFQSATLTFTMPSGYAKANAVVGMGLGTTAMAAITPAPTVGGTGPYTYTYTSTGLGTILSSLFGSTVYLGVHTADGTWNSGWTTHKLAIGLAGLGSTCTLS